MDKSILINILDNQETGILILNKEKEVIYVNKKTRDLLGNDVNQLLGNYIKCEHTIKESEKCQNTSNCNNCVINKAIDRVIKKNETETVNNIEIKKNNIEINLSMKISAHEKYLLIEIFNLNIKNFQKEFLFKLADKSKDIMFFKDEQLKYIYVNKTYADFFNKDKEYIIGKTDNDLFEKNLLDRLLYEQCLIGDKETLGKGYYYGIEVIGDKSFRVSKENIDGGILGIARDVTNEINAIEKSQTDQLTGIYNRYKLEALIEDIYSNKRREYYMALIDLDDLRVLNNTYGHIKGDNYLKALSRVLKYQKDCTFFRIGGDEFAAFIDSNKIRPNEILKTIFEEISMLNLYPKLSISVGVEKFDIDKSFEENYEVVDSILYESKQSGKSKYITGRG